MDFNGVAVNRPWALMPDSFETMLTSRPAAALPRRSAAEWSSSGSNIAVLPLLGMLSRRSNPVDFVGDTSLEAFGAIFNELVKDSSISSIVLDIDSPGGNVYGVEELARRVFDAREKKRVVAIANSLMASAAYWIGSAADEVSISPSGEVGSIGIIAVHQDFSRAEDAAGVAVTLISAGKYKTEANEHEPLDGTARAALQSRVSSYHRMFVRAVAKHRGVSYADVADGFGEGRVVGAADSLKMGMVDRIETIDQLLDRIASTQAPAKIPHTRADSDFGMSQEHAAARTRLRDALARVKR